MDVFQRHLGPSFVPADLHELRLLHVLLAEVEALLGDVGERRVDVPLARRETGPHLRVDDRHLRGGARPGDLTTGRLGEGRDERRVAFLTRDEVLDARRHLRHRHLVEQRRQRAEPLGVRRADGHERARRRLNRLVEVFLGDQLAVEQDARDHQVDDLLHVREQVVDRLLLVEDQLDLGQAEAVDRALVEREHRVGDVVQLLLEHDGVGLADVVLDLVRLAVVVLPDRDPLEAVAKLRGVAVLVGVGDPLRVAVGLHVRNLGRLVDARLHAALKLGPRDDRGLQPVADVIGVADGLVEEDRARLQHPHDGSVAVHVPAGLEHAALAEDRVDERGRGPAPHVVHVEDVVHEPVDERDGVLALTVARVGGDLRVGPEQRRHRGVRDGVDHVLRAKERRNRAVAQVHIVARRVELAAVVAPRLVEVLLLGALVEATMTVDESREVHVHSRAMGLKGLRAAARS